MRIKPYAIKSPATAFWSAVVITIALLAACSGRTGAPEVTQGKSQVKNDFQITLYQGKEALGGKEEGLYSDLFAQGKPVVLNMWAGLCPPCRKEMPDLQQVYEIYKDRLVVFGLDVGPFVRLGSRQQGQALLKIYGITYPAGTTYDPEVVSAYEITSMPTTFFVTPDGTIVRRWAGLLSKDKMVELVEELLTKSRTTP